MEHEQEPDEIRLSVPADPAFARVARVAAGGLAARLGFSYDEVEEVRLAAAEAWAATLGGEDRPGRVELVLRALGDGMLELELTVPGSTAEAPTAAPTEDEAGATPAAVLAALAERVELAADRSTVRLLLRSAG